MDSSPATSRAFTVDHARVLAIAGPMTLANLTTPLLGVVGTAVIGQLGQAHLLGAVAISAVVLPVIFFTIGKTIDVAVQVYLRRREEKRKPEQE